MNYYLLDWLNRVNHQYINKMYSMGKLIKVTLLNVNFTFQCDSGLNEKTETFIPTQDVELAPIVDKRNRPNKSNRGKKSNKKLEKKMNKFGSNIKFKVYDEEYDKKFTVIVFRINNGGVPGLTYNDDALILRLINKVFDSINRQFPEKNFRYTGHTINLCNLRGYVLVNQPLFRPESNIIIIKKNNHEHSKKKIINIYLLRDLLYVIHNKECENMLLKDKDIKQIREINEYDHDLILRDSFVDCLIKDSNVYLVIYYRINNKIITCKVYNILKLYCLGSKTIMDNYDILYNIKHIIYRYHNFLLSDA